MQVDYRYPIGEYEPQPFSESLKDEWLSDIRFLPQAVENAILNLNENQIQTPYREGGWTIHQLVHHLADSHMNAYCRFKLGYTEDNPLVKAYDENAWANTNDVKVLPINVSITLLHALHLRWYEFLKDINDAEWNRTVIHSAQQKEFSLWHLLGMYSWHGRHHTAHITALRERMNWN